MPTRHIAKATRPLRPGTFADHMMLATRTLLADRCKLKVHRETRELDIYALMMAKADGKPGRKLKVAGDDCSPERLAARRGAPPPAQVPDPSVAHFESARARIMDRSGLTGNYDFELLYAAPPSNAPFPPGDRAAAVRSTASMWRRRIRAA